MEGEETERFLAISRKIQVTMNGFCKRVNGRQSPPGFQRHLFRRMTVTTSCLLAILALPTSHARAQEEEKNPEDPTKVITKVGLAYNQDLVLSGALSFDEVRKINGRINHDASEWRIGGSWLFKFGIVNVNFSRTDFDADAYKNNYSVGTFLPLSALGVSTGKWQVFPTAGFSYNQGENYLQADDPSLAEDLVLLPTASFGGYLGAFALRPLSDRWTFMSVLGGSIGSDSYAGVWVGAGISFRLTQRQSVNGFGFLSEDDYGRVEKLSIAYTYEFGG